MKRKIAAFFAAICLLGVVFSTLPTYATEVQYIPEDSEQIPENPQPDYDDGELSEERIGAISQNCSSIKVQLRRVQRADAKSRVHLGAQFEVISSNLMLNLNLRLLKNNLATPELTTQQTKFASERERFKNDYIGYSQELEKLINSDCQKQPENFYRQLQTVRRKRDDIQQSILRLNSIIDEHRSSVEVLKESL